MDICKLQKEKLYFRQNMNGGKKDPLKITKGIVSMTDSCQSYYQIGKELLPRNVTFWLARVCKLWHAMNILVIVLGYSGWVFSIKMH